MKYKEKYRVEHAGEIADRKKQLKFYKMIFGNLAMFFIVITVMGFCAVDYNPTVGTISMMLGMIATTVIFHIGEMFDKE